MAERPVYHASPLVNVSRQIGVWLGHQSIPQMAAALAYRTVFSIIPICVIALVVLKRFMGKDDVDRLFNRFMELIGINQLNEAQAGTVQEKMDTVLAAFDKISFTGIGLVSALLLIYSAISLLIEMENAFNRLYGSSRGRLFHRRVMQYWFVVSLGPLLLALSFFVVERITGLAGSLAGGWGLGFAAYLASVAITAALLWSLYYTVPNAKVRALPALYGALAAAVAMEAAKFGFQYYLKNASYQSVYGVLALIPLFLLWIYTTWMVVLTGLRLAYLTQHGRHVALLHVSQGAREGTGLMDPSYAVMVAATVARGFAKGRPVDADQVGERLGISWDLAWRILKRLAEDGVLAVVSDRGLDRYTLARPAETIALADVLQVGFDMGGSGSGTPAFVSQMRAAQLETLRGQTLISLLDLPTPPAAAPKLSGEPAGAAAHA